VAVHVRQASAVAARRVLERVRSGPGSWPGVHVTEGNAVLELSVVRTDKGDALEVVRQQSGATAAVFLGDSVSDEKVYARLSGPDVGIKVGPGDTLAAWRVADSAEVAAVLSWLWEERRSWLYGKVAPPIWSRRRQESAGSASPGRPRRRCSRTCWAARRRDTSRSGRSATGCPWGSGTCPAR
jgi:trehalose 6-phosphate phosphatase